MVHHQGKSILQMCVTNSKKTTGIAKDRMAYSPASAVLS
jgi:hypothetical protein